ncbi:uncharacterized protein LOC119126110 isoform X1 [Syngnathus acus]|uniref:uncharacterized protein LOC119126110 isoform X1 n=1 Tax=Syngnathus acus TaxID=161584 RepID=UPI001885EEA0|nr:uncharacterized protein LOC119126110 isoform X1 [Syngnathus acus]
MGRLDDAAKRKVVELRKAGLSFRKIKAVLELENIKVSAQAIYLFLREFQGRRPGRVRPPEAGSNAAAPAPLQNLVGGLQETWSGMGLQHLLRDASRNASLSKLAKRASTQANGGAKASRCVESGVETETHQRQQRQQRQQLQQRWQCVDDTDVQIVSVTSLAQCQQSPESSAATCPVTASVALARRRVTPSPATSSMLAARKRILDKALMHRMKVTSLLRREHAHVQRQQQQQQPPPPPSAASSSAPAAATTTAPTYYDLTAEKSTLEDGGTDMTRRFVPQRPGLSVRSLHTAPRVEIQLAGRSAAPLTSPGGAVLHARTSAGEPSRDTGAGGALQDQIRTLGCEVRSLGLAVKMLAEQQSRLETEQAQQTHIQKQILGALQTLASKARPCGNTRQTLSKTPSPSCLPTTSSAFNQDTFNFNRVTLGQCSQTQTAYDSLESLEPVEPFKLAILSPDGTDGFPPCSSTENLPLTHTHPHTQQAGPYPQQNCQTLLAPYAQSYAPAYERSHPQGFREGASKTDDFRTTQDQHLNIIKVEGP